MACVGETKDGVKIHGTYIQASRAWYAETALRPNSTADEVWIMCRTEVDVSEFAIRWHRFKSQPSGTPPSPQLGMFDEAWEWLRICPAFFDWLADNHNVKITPEQVCRKLSALGFEDETVEVNPETGESRKDLPLGKAPPEAKGGE